MAPTWDPTQYLRYANERERPYWELVAHIPAPPRRVVDLGCRPGTTTAGLPDHWPEATSAPSTPGTVRRQYDVLRALIPAAVDADPRATPAIYAQTTTANDRLKS